MRHDNIWKEVAISNSFIKTAKSDLNSARILLKNKEYSNSLYHSQQAIEKILKAMLALKGRFIYKHEVIAEFCKVFQKTVSQDLINLVKDEGFKIEQEGSSFRYPDFSGIEIFDPAEEFDKEDAKEGYKTAKEIVSTAVKELKKIKKLLS
jgi:HEPN domain-containing protein